MRATSAPNEAKQLYMEQFGEALLTGSYLKLAVALLVLAVAGLVVLNVKTIHTFRNFKPLIIRPRYETGNVVRYTRGSKQFRLRATEYATVTRVDPQQNLVTVRRQDGQEISYDPRRLQGVNVYEVEQRELSRGERIQFTAPFRKERIANRELATVDRIEGDARLRLRLESGRNVEFNIREHPHLDYGYAMTSYSSQGQTADRVIVHVAGRDLENRELTNRRFAYAALSRAREDAQIYTNDAAALAVKLDRQVSKEVAIDVKPVQVQELGKAAAQQQKRQPALEQSIA